MMFLALCSAGLKALPLATPLAQRVCQSPTTLSIGRITEHGKADGVTRVILPTTSAAMAMQAGKPLASIWTATTTNDRL